MNIRRNLLALCLLLFTTASLSNAAVTNIDNKPPKEKRADLTEEQIARIEAIRNRVEEIKAMDRSKLTKAERTKLHRELKDLNKEARGMSGKSFIITLGIIIIVILVLILLL